MSNTPPNDSRARSGNRADVRDFLSSRRARITPDQVGLPVTGRRRVPGLRREEVAVLAGVSIEWYTRLEKGHIGDVSEGVLEAVARALQLDDDERVYLFDLARAAQPTRPADRGRRDAPLPHLPASVQWLLDSMTMSTAMVTDARQDIVAINPLGRALYSPLFDGVTTRNGQPANLARYHFLDPGARDFYGAWNVTADVLVALLRAEAGRHPHDVKTQDLVAGLSTASADFRTRWAAHNILTYTHGAKTFHHPEIGRITLAYRSLDLPISAQAVPHLCVCTAEPGSVAEDQLKLLASWAAPQPQPTGPTDQRG